MLQHDGGYVAVADIGMCGFGNGPGQHEVFVAKDADMGEAVVQQGEAIPAGAVVRVVEVFGGDGDEFALVGGGAAGFGKPGDEAGPEDVGFAVHHADDEVADVVVFADGDLVSELFVGLYLPESKLLADFSAAGLLDKGGELFLLKGVDVLFGVAQAVVQVGEVPGDDGVDEGIGPHGALLR